MSSKKRAKSRDAKAQKDEESAGVSAAAAADCCPVCLEKLVYPCRLPCRHVFCFLCLKGSVMNITTTCPLCRAPVPSDYLDHPQLVLSTEDFQELTEGKQAKALSPARAEAASEAAAAGAKEEDEKYAWFYEGKHGFWMYEERTNMELESQYQRDPHANFQCLIAGKMYNIDFNLNLQYRVDDPSRKRKIKRDLVSAEKKGVAGLKQSLIRDTIAHAAPKTTAESSPPPLSPDAAIAATPKPKRRGRKKLKR